MEEEIRHRILQVFDNKRVTVSAFAVINKENKSKLSKQIMHSTTISLHTILLILNQYPDVSSEWLLRGKGEMFITEQPSHEERISRLERMVNEISEKDSK